MIVVEKELSPSGLEHDRIYVVVLAGLTEIEPDGAATPPIPWSIKQDWALEHVQESVADCGGTNGFGLPPKEQFGSCGVIEVKIQLLKQGKIPPPAQPNPPPTFPNGLPGSCCCTGNVLLPGINNVAWTALGVVPSEPLVADILKAYVPGAGGVKGA